MVSEQVHEAYNVIEPYANPKTVIIQAPVSLVAGKVIRGCWALPG